MRVTPLDIRKQEFRKVMRGLDSEEVYAFLQTVADEYEAVLSDNKNLREHMVELEDRLKEYKNIEMNLRNTLLTAEKITAEAKENARREASLIIREAEMEAEKAAETIRAHTMQLRREILELKKQKDNYITRLKTLLESHRKVLEGFEEDFFEVDRAIEQIGEQVEMDIKQAVTPPRMSRQKITEDTVMGPRDKVTWGDERKREDESRPSMPKPDWHGKQGAERDDASTGDDSEAREDREAKAPSASMEREFSPAYTEIQPASGAVNEEAARHLDTEPVGAVDEAVADGRTDGGARVEAPWDQDGRTEMNAGLDDGAARRIVEQSMSERLYPEAHIDNSEQRASRVAESGVFQHDADGPHGTKAPHTAPADQALRFQGPQAPRAGTHPAEHVTQPHTAGQTGVGAAVMEADAPSERSAPKPEAQGARNQPGAADQVELKETQDDWKHYEVKDKKPDWSNYEVPRSASEIERQAASPTDKEVEKALAGLTEMSAAMKMMAEDSNPPQDMEVEVPVQQKEPPAVQAPAGKSKQQNEMTSAAQPPKQRKERPAAVQPPAQAPESGIRQEPAGEAGDETPRAEQPTAEPPVDNGKNNSFWSMDQLRKNLSNFIGREEEQQEVQDEAREE